MSKQKKQEDKQQLQVNRIHYRTFYSRLSSTTFDSYNTSIAIWLAPTTYTARIISACRESLGGTQSSVCAKTRTVCTGDTTLELVIIRTIDNRRVRP